MQNIMEIKQDIDIIAQDDILIKLNGHREISWESSHVKQENGIFLSNTENTDRCSLYMNYE